MYIIRIMKGRDVLKTIFYNVARRVERAIPLNTMIE